MVRISSILYCLPKVIVLQQGSKCENPDELAQASDSGERKQLTPL